MEAPIWYYSNIVLYFFFFSILLLRSFAYSFFKNFTRTVPIKNRSTIQNLFESCEKLLTNPHNGLLIHIAYPYNTTSIHKISRENILYIYIYIFSRRRNQTNKAIDLSKHDQIHLLPLPAILSIVPTYYGVVRYKQNVNKTPPLLPN